MYEGFFETSLTINVRTNINKIEMIEVKLENIKYELKPRDRRFIAISSS
jgi:hypothetical protein